MLQCAVSHFQTSTTSGWSTNPHTCFSVFAAHPTFLWALRPVCVTLMPTYFIHSKLISWAKSKVNSSVLFICFSIRSFALGLSQTAQLLIWLLLFCCWAYLAHPQPVLFFPLRFSQTITLPELESRVAVLIFWVPLHRI